MGTGADARLTDEDVRAIEALQARWLEVERAGQTGGVLDLCDDDVVWLPPGGRPMRGRESILHWLSGPPVRVHDLTLTHLEIAGEGRVAWTTCEFVTTHQAPGGGVPVTDRGALLWVLRKADDGMWRIVAATWTLR